ncbi:helicase associated domain-containing protein [Kitasatospora sp. NPDC058190]|uniref:helicase associated domain-containing protein n=1 Tax=Kitasatospora sp. NPDC058190 TaxID=3346371 RepID=UPI0036DB890F
MALRSHDAAAVERLALPQSESRPPREPRHAGEPDAFRSAGGEAQLLQFSTQRDPAAFVRTRVLEPEREEFRRGLEELLAYRAPSRHRLGVWVADQRRYKAADVLDAERVKELDALGMVWSAFDTAFTDNLTAVAGYAAEHGHARPSNEAVWGGRPVGTIMKNLRTAQRRTEALQRRAEAGEQGLDWAGVLTADRKAALDEIDPAWCPAWSVEWQRCFALVWRHIKDGGALAGAAPGSVVVQGEDLAGWGRAQQVGWDKLAPAQQWALEHVLGLKPLPEEQRPAVKVTHAEKGRRNLAAAAQYRAREWHLNVASARNPWSWPTAPPCRSASACSSPTAAAGAPTSPPNAPPASPNSACAGNRRCRTGPERAGCNVPAATRPGRPPDQAKSQVRGATRGRVAPLCCSQRPGYAGGRRTGHTPPGRGQWKVSTGAIRRGLSRRPDYHLMWAARDAGVSGSCRLVRRRTTARRARGYAGSATAPPSAPNSSGASHHGTSSTERPSGQRQRREGGKSDSSIRMFLCWGSRYAPGSHP